MDEKENNFHDKSTEELDRLKKIADLKNADDIGLSKFEKFIKRRIVPIFIPLLTLSATVTFFTLNFYDGEKKKAIERYNSELELVKMVWDDVNEDTLPHSTKYYKSIEFLKQMFKANRSTLKEDEEYIGIDSLHRPIALLQSINADLNNSIKNTTKNNDKNLIVEKKLEKFNSSTSKDPVVLTSDNNVKAISPVIKQKTKINDALNSVPEVTNNYKIYLQYSDKTNIEKVEFLASQLKDYYVLAPLDYVVNNSGYLNEIRYYKETDLPEAKKLEQILKNSTGQDFQLKNINYNKGTGKIMEVWYNNTIPNIPTLEKSKLPIIDSKDNNYKIIYEGNHYAAKGYSNSIINGIDIYIEGYNNDTATLSVNGKKDLILQINKGKSAVLEYGRYKITIKINDYKRNYTIRKVVLYSVVIQEKIN